MAVSKKYTLSRSRERWQRDGWDGRDGHKRSMVGRHAGDCLMFDDLDVYCGDSMAVFLGMMVECMMVGFQLYNH